MDESPYIEAVLQSSKHALHKILFEDHAPLDSTEEMIADQNGSNFCREHGQVPKALLHRV